MPAYVHINMRVIDPARQAALLPRFQAALREAGGHILHFGPVAKVLEGSEAPPAACRRVRISRPRNRARVCSESERYAPIKAERREAQEARMFVVDAA